ncbi:glycoside hydrolase family 18 protein [Herbidospora sp. RD11066]
MDSATQPRPGGTPSRALVTAAATALVGATAAALWLLPAEPLPEWAAPVVPPVAAAPAVAVAPKAERTIPYVTFIDAIRSEGGVSRAPSYLVGHVNATGCVPTWSGLPASAKKPLVSTLHKTGRPVSLSFGGPQGPELAATCDGPARLLRAYRSVLKTYRPESIDFEVTDSADTLTTTRRAVAIQRLQEEARRAGSELLVSMTLPATSVGLSIADRAMLKATWAAGAEIGRVNLLVPFAPGERGNLRALADVAHATNRQLTRLLNRPAWPHLGLTPVLASADDLTVADARTLVAFQTKNSLGELSIRGATPEEEVARILTAPRQ